MSLYGARAVKDQTDIDLTIYLEPYEVGGEFDRLGNGVKNIILADVEVPQIKIPFVSTRFIVAPHFFKKTDPVR